MCQFTNFRHFVTKRQAEDFLVFTYGSFVMNEQKGLPAEPLANNQRTNGSFKLRKIA